MYSYMQLKIIISHWYCEGVNTLSQRRRELAEEVHEGKKEG